METIIHQPIDHTSPEPVGNGKPDKFNILYLIIGLIIFFIATSSTYFLGLRQGKKLTETPQQSLISITPTPDIPISTPTPQPLINPEINEFKTRYFGTTEYFFDNEKYPAELTDLPEKALTPISCTRTYSAVGKDFSYIDETTHNTIPLADSKLLNYIQSINKMNEGKKVTEIFTCMPKEGNTIVVYSLGPCGGGCSGLPYIGIINNAGDIKEIGEITEMMAYFGCRQPLQLSNNNFYLKCGGGDGPGGSISIYKLSLNNQSITRIKYCENGIDKSGKSYLRCQ